MTNCIFYSLFFALFLNVSIGSLKFSQIHRTFMSLYKGMFEACSITIDTNGEPTTPYYNTVKMRSYLDGYFNENLSRHAKDYSYTYRFLDSNNSYCTNQCRKVEIRLVADINFLYNYDRTETFTIVDGDTLWTKNYWTILKILSCLHF